MSQVEKIVTDTIRATYHLLDTNRRINSFELFGYDIMLDDDFKPYLIEVNSNPSLECSCALLTKLFSEMIDNTFRIVLDPLFPPPPGFSQKKVSIGQDFLVINRFELIFDERVDKEFLSQRMSKIDPADLRELQNLEMEDSEEEAYDDKEGLE